MRFGSLIPCLEFRISNFEFRNLRNGAKRARGLLGALFLFLALIALPFPAHAKSEARLIPEDQFATPGAKTYLSARLERTGLWPGKRALSGERVEFLVKGKSLGIALTDEGGTAARAHAFPATPGIYPFTVRLHSKEHQAVEATGLVAVWEKKKPILVVILEGAAVQLPSKRPLLPWQEGPLPALPGSAEALASLARRAQIVYLTRRDEGQRHALKKWLGEHRFPAAPLFSWPGDHPLERRHEDLASFLEQWETEGWDLRLGVGSPVRPRPQRSSGDCGQPAGSLTPVFDPSTRAELALCPTCTLAFAQRQRFHQGCCD